MTYKLEYLYFLRFSRYFSLLLLSDFNNWGKKKYSLCNLSSKKAMRPKPNSLPHLNGPTQNHNGLKNRSSAGPM